MKEYSRRICSKFKLGLIHIGYYSKPGFLIIGAQKAGTVALYKYLSEHPNIVPASKKEIVFFNQEGRSFLHERPGITSASEREIDFFRPEVYNKSKAWYHSHFPLPHRLGLHGITFETTPGYLYYPASAERIFSYDPKIKLIALLRDPVERAFSSWNMFRDLYKNPDHCCHYLGESREFDETVRDETDNMSSADAPFEPSYVRRGLYYEQLLRYFKYFKHDQILIIDSRSLRNNTPFVLHQVIQFLGLPVYNWHQIDLPLYHVREYEKPMSEKTRVFLQEFYKPHNERLYELLDYDFGWQ